MKNNRTISLLRLLVFSIFLGFLHYSNNVQPLSSAALVYAIYLIVKLFDALGEQVPYKQLILALMGIQLLIAPFLEYYYFNNEVFGVMRVEEYTYFSYAFPAILALHLGVNLFYPKQKFEKKIASISEEAPLINKSGIGWNLIIVGSLAQVLSQLIEIPAGLGFLVTILIFSRFVGLLYLWFNNSPSIRWAFAIVFIPFIIQVIQNSIFIDLIIISALFASVFMMKQRVSKVWIYSGALLAFSFLVILQSVKHSYRTLIWKSEYEGNKVLLLYEMVATQVVSIPSLDLKEIGSGVNVRLNQGWILGDILNNVPAKGDNSNKLYIKGELLGVILPRFLFPDKPIVGDKQKFAAFTGWSLGSTTSMNVGILGDGYGNFGYRGGILFCFGFGVALGLIFKLFYKFSKKRVSLLFWGPLIFFYSMRAGNEFYIISNWMVKSGVFVMVYFSLFEKGRSMRPLLQGKPTLSQSKVCPNS